MHICRHRSGRIAKVGTACAGEVSYGAGIPGEEMGCIGGVGGRGSLRCEGNIEENVGSVEDEQVLPTTQHTTTQSTLHVSCLTAVNGSVATISNSQKSSTISIVSSKNKSLISLTCTETLY